MIRTKYDVSCLAQHLILRTSLSESVNFKIVKEINTTRMQQCRYAGRCIEKKK
jgi:hypothetical protein